MKINTQIKAEKIIMRCTMKKRARSFEIPLESSVYAKKLLLLDAVQKASVVFVYVSYGKEIPTHDLIKALLRSGVKVCVPKVIGKKMLAVQIYKYSELRKSTGGILEPTTTNPYSGPIDCVITPGFAFSTRKERLGKGGGYYDQFLAQYSPAHPRPHLVGVCWHWQIVGRLPVESHDIRMDKIIVL